MKSCLILSILFLAGSGWAQASPDAPKPLAKDQVLQLLKTRVESGKLVKQLEAQGIDFETDLAYLRSLRDAGASQAVIDAVVAATPSRRRLRRANTLLGAGEIDAAIPEYRESLRLNPYNLEAHRMLGIALGKKGDWRGDLVEQRLVLRSQPSDALAKAELMALLKGGSGADIGQLEIVTAPKADVYFNDKIEGRVGGDGRFRIMAKPGLHALRISLAGKQNFRQDVTLALGQVTKVTAVLADAGSTPAK